MGFIIISMSYFINTKHSNILLGIAYFILSIVAFTFQNKIKPTPKLATCLEDSGMLVSVLTNLFLTTGLGLVLLLTVFGLDGFFDDATSILAIFITMFLVGLGGYLYNCKKNVVVE
jgi:drug/metabolite transporter (DMT)-like permease